MPSRFRSTSPQGGVDLELPAFASSPIATVTSGPEPDLRDYDLIVVNMSGKDAHAALERITTTVRATG